MAALRHRQWHNPPPSDGSMQPKAVRVPFPAPRSFTIQTALEQFPTDEPGPDIGEVPDLPGTGPGDAPPWHVPAQTSSPLPPIDVPSTSSISVPASGDMIPAAESQISEYPPMDVPVLDEVKDFSPLDLGTLSFGEQDTEPLKLSDPGEYKLSVQEQLTTKHTNIPGLPIGYLDHLGYVVEWEKTDTGEGPTSLGEATYFTAVAIIALATGNYKPDDWESKNANLYISGFLELLENSSWGNEDSLGVKHPIRHPDWFEYQKNGKKRNRPMSKDSFGQIVVACYYTYNCSNSDSTVRAQAQRVLKKYIDYLSTHNWLLHSNYIDGEFEKDSEGNYKNLFATDHGGPIALVDQITFILYPHELYALRNCADSLSVPNQVILLSHALEIENQLSVHTYVAQYVAQYSAVAFRWILDNLKFQKHGDLELAPGWARSKINLSFKLGLPEASKDRLQDAFEGVLRASLARFDDLTKLNSEADAILADAIGEVLGLFEESFYELPLASILKNLLDQLLPWLHPELLVEFAFFVLALEVIGSPPSKASNIGYTVWPIVIEMESRPAFVPLYRSLIKKLVFEYISTHDNPNGIWAWLCGEDAVVRDQLDRFEKESPDHWVIYAYASTDYDKWVTEAVAKPDKSNGSSSRVDYLVLQCLAKKGSPRAAPAIGVDFSAFVKACEAAFEDLLKKYVTNFASLGFLEQTFTDAAGSLVRDTIRAVGAFERVITHADGRISKLVHDRAGWAGQAIWSGNLILLSYSKWYKVAFDGVGAVEDLMELQIRTLEGAVKVWMWGEGKVLKNFEIYAVAPINGVFDKAKRALVQIRNAEGKLEQWIYHEGTLLNYCGWATSTATGLAAEADCILLILRDPAGQLKRWSYEVGRNLKDFTHYLTSTPLGGTEVVDVLLFGVRDATGALDVTFKQNGEFLKRWQWINSTAAGTIIPADLILHQLRAIDTSLEEWHLEAAIPKIYRKWARSTAAGFSEGADIVKSVEKQLNGQFVVRTFQNGVEVVGQVVDAVGRVLSNIGNAVGDVWDSATGFIKIHW